MPYSQAFTLACQCMVGEQFLSVYGSELQWVGVEVDAGELLAFIEETIASKV